MKPFRVWGTRAAALALLLVMATNALATPSHPIDDDPQAPPIPTVFVGDPDTGYGGRARYIDPGSFLVQAIRLQIMMLTHANVQLRWTASASVGHREVRHHD